MPRYMSQWLDYRLPTGQDFAVAVCGYSGKVRHMYIGNDPVRRMIVQHVDVIQNVDTGDECCQADHCLALDCPLNRAEQEHLLHMLDMNEDEPLDPEAAGQWGTQSTLDCLLKFAQKMNEFLPDELKKPQKPVEE
jgi:hypothetical protein